MSMDLRTLALFAGVITAMGGIEPMAPISRPKRETPPEVVEYYKRRAQEKRDRKAAKKAHAGQ